MSDPDLFFGFMRHFLFHDLHLASLLLFHAESIEHEIQLIAQYFPRRIKELHDNAPAFVEQYEAVLASWTPGRTHILGEDSDVPHADYESFSPQLETRLESECVVRQLRTMHWRWPKLSACRQVLRFAVVTADVSIDADGQFAAMPVGSGVPFTGPVMNDARPLDGGGASGMGTVEALLLADRTTVLFGVFLGGDLIAFKNIETGAFNDASAAKGLEGIPSWISIEAALVQIEEERYLSENSRGGPLLREYPSRAREQAYEMYYEIGLGRDDEAEIDRQLLAKLDAKGLASLFGSDDQRAIEFASKVSLLVNRAPIAFSYLPDLLKISEDQIRSSYEKWKHETCIQLGFLTFFEKSGFLYLSRI